MYDCYRKSLLYLKGFTLMRSFPIPNPTLGLVLQHIASIQLPKYRIKATTASNKQSLTVNFLVNNCGFSPEAASEASERFSVLNSPKADSIVKLFRNLNLSDSQLHDVIKKAPWLLSCDPGNTLSPKLDFFKSKGVSTSLLAHFVTTNPLFLRQSLDNHLIPTFDLMKRFLHSDKMTIATMKRWFRIITDYRFRHNAKLLLDNGVPDSSIALLLRHWPGVINYAVEAFRKKVDEVKKMGFDTSKSTFVLALRVKVVMSNSLWERRVELYGRWGWSNEAIHKAFAKRPLFILTSDSKIEAVMEFFVIHMGWDSLVLAEQPTLLNLSLEKRIIPRASVLQFLHSRGLIMNPNHAPFTLTDEKFHQKFVNSFKDKAPELLKLYEGKLNLSG